MALRDKKTRVYKKIPFLIILVILLLVPVLGDSFFVFLLSRALFLGLAALSLYVAMGLGGMMSFAQMAFYGITAYSVGIFTTKFNLGFGVSVLLAFIVLLVIAGVFNLIAIRTRGNYFLMITLAFGQMLYLAALQWVELTGGFSGITKIPVPEIFNGRDPLYFFILIVVVVFYFLVKRLVNSPFGVALQGVREHEEKIMSLGFNRDLIRYVAMMIASLMAGVSGILSVLFYTMISPNTLAMSNSIMLLFMVLIGGSNYPEGALLGSLIYVILQDVLSQWTERYQIIIGIFFILIVLFMPNGILGFTERKKNKSEG